MRRPLRAAWARLYACWRDRRAVAAVEFAFILPLMLVVYIGAIDVTRGVLASRKVTLVSRTIADLVAQQSTTRTMPTSRVSTIFDASAAIMQPFTTTGIKTTVSALTVKAKSSGVCCDVTVDWSYTYNGTLRPCNVTLSQVASGTPPSATNVPQNLVTANQQAGYGYTQTKVSYLIVADVTYAYTPLFSQAAGWFSGSFQKTSFMVPRSKLGQIRLTNTDSAGTGQSGAICP